MKTDNIPVEVKTLFIALLVGVAHVVSGITVAAYPAALLVTPLSGLHWVSQQLGYSHGFSAAILILAGAMAIIGSTTRLIFNRYAHVALFLPQQLLIVMQLVSLTYALTTGVYPDGYHPNGGAWFILADQSWAWVLSISHTIWLTAFILSGDHQSWRALSKMS